MQTPFFMRKEIMAKCAQLAQFDEELYKVSPKRCPFLHIMVLLSNRVFICLCIEKLGHVFQYFLGVC